MQMPMLAVRVRLAAAEGWARADADVRDAAALGWARQTGGGRRRRKRRRSETVMQLGGCSAVGDVDARSGPTAAPLPSERGRGARQRRGVRRWRRGAKDGVSCAGVGLEVGTSWTVVHLRTTGKERAPS
jgi:hypothetical protein